MPLINVNVEPVSYSEARFWVEAATDIDEFTSVDLLFANEDLARRAAVELAKEFEWVQISEWGRWQLRSGRSREGWIAFWWTGACEYNQPPPASSGELGVPEGAVRIVRYVSAERPEDE